MPVNLLRGGLSFSQLIGRNQLEKGICEGVPKSCGHHCAFTGNSKDLVKNESLCGNEKRLKWKC